MNDAPVRIRRDPRAAALGRRPTDRAAPSAPAIVRVDAPACHVIAVPDLVAGKISRRDRELLGAARQLADRLSGAVVAALCVPAATALPGDLDETGADRVMRLDDSLFATTDAETRVAAIVAAAQTLDARAILFCDTPQAGGELGRRLAARLGERPAVEVVRFDADTVTTRQDGGRTECTRPLPRILILAAEAFAPVARAPKREARQVDAPAFTAERRAADGGMIAVDPAAIPLAEAELIVSAGNGVHDWTAFHALARALGAAEGGSRVVCDAGHLARTRQVGASGTLVAARGYVAFGIAGASQHLEGIAACDRVVAVNTDPHAAIMNRADLAIIGDAQEIMPALLHRLEGAGP